MDRHDCLHVQPQSLDIVVEIPGVAAPVLGLGGLVFGLLEWPPLGANHPLVVGAFFVGLASLTLFVVVERQTENPMMPGSPSFCFSCR